MAGEFLTRDEIERVSAAIRAAESNTSCELRVHLEKRCTSDALTRARELLTQLGMRATERRNAVLLYIATGDRLFAIAGDEAAHEAVGGDTFWNGTRDRLSARFRDGRFCDGICEALSEVGERLTARFPQADGGDNELPDEPTFGD